MKISNKKQAFKILGEKVLPETIKLKSWCPSMDLLAFITTSNEIWVYRLSGSRVWKTLNKNHEATSITWRPDGKVLVVGLSNGTIRLYNVNDGLLLHTIEPQAPEFDRVSLVSWVTEKRKLSFSEEQFSLQEFDPIKFLPRLASIPSEKSRNFSNSSLTNFVSTNNEDKQINEMDLLISGDMRGNLHISICGLFHLALLPLVSTDKITNTQRQLLCHFSSSDLRIQSTISKNEQTQEVFIHLLDMKAFRALGASVTEIAKCSTNFHFLLTYIKEGITTITEEWQNMNDIEQEYLQAFYDCLNEHNVANVATPRLELFSLVMTGIPSAPLRDWMTKRLTERGLKKWEKTSLASYENLRKLTHQYILPACDRVALLLSKLNGLAKWPKTAKPMFIDSKKIQACLYILHIFIENLYNFIEKINEEVQLFKSFTIWMKFIFEEISPTELVTDTTLHPANALEVAKFIETVFPASSISEFITSDEKLILPNNFDSYSYNFQEKRPRLSFKVILENLMSYGTLIFNKPAAELNNQWTRLMHQLLSKNLSNALLDMRLIDYDNYYSVYIAGYPKKKEDDIFSSHIFQIIRFNLHDDGTKISMNSEYVSIDLTINSQEFWIIQDLAFVDDKNIILLLYKNDNEEYILADFNYIKLDYKEHILNTSKELFDFTLKQDSIKINFSRCRRFTSDFVPQSITINGLPGRRIGCILANDLQRYQIFDIDVDDDNDEDSQESILDDN
ncbi:hypothetical protein T552_02379 [Pneumocystis carinii B80]|uniref:Anaphase-promoting complex subunit 4 n=1 Tax=Pneumocystis carinii (strain B80) TaxID=1408658 RepID=A0A0W4ZGA4_PNEC8|nr:hypothetical protein T552_02379 [Pneumocystis carinii B80]KTW27400.1 hypothetical protein T552_02379 [Pneumocystis carinii B80]